MRIYKILILILVGIISNRCGGDGDDPPPPPVVTPPTATVLLYPTQNSECLQGINPTNTQSTIIFEWDFSSNTDSYDLVVKNLISGSSSTYSTTEKTKSVTLNKSVPYSWKIISKSTSTTQTATSAIWKFYNAGDGIQSYPPFPAEIVSPRMGEFVTATDNKINLKWTGSDVENDISGYDIYFGTVNPPTLHKANHTTMELTNVSVTTNTVYFWKIVTKDIKGNASDTGVYNFKTN